MKYTTIRVTPATLQAALTKAETLLRKPGDKEVTLSFSGGHYHMDNPVVWDGADFPGKAHLRLMGGGRLATVFSALTALPMEQFQAVPDKPYYVYQFPTQADGSYPKLRTVYADGKIADVSRTAEYRSTGRFTRGDMTYETRQSAFNDTHMLYVPMAAIDEAGLENCVGAELHIRVEWEFKIFHIARIDTEDCWIDENGERHVAMHIDPAELNGGNGTLAMYGRVFFICNTTSVLTTPGQYTYEQTSGRLYYYPIGDMADHTLSIGCQTGLFTLNRFASLTLRGLTFTGTEDDILTQTGYYAAGQAGRWTEFPERFPHAGAVRVNTVDEMTVENCTFTDLPCDGLSMVGLLHNVTVKSCRFIGIGATAIRMGRPVAGEPENNMIRNLAIVNNYLDNIGFTYENSCSILATQVKDGRLNHNTILRSSYTAISLGWKWNVATWEYGADVNLDNVEVAYNYIKSFLMRMRDGGGIYTLGGNATVQHAAFMNTLHDNYVIEDELTCPENGFFGSLYHDGASSHWHTYNNIVIHNPARTGSTGSFSARMYLQCAAGPVGTGSVEGQAAWHILCENNFFCCCKNFGDIYRSQRVDPEKASNMLDISRDLREKDTHVLKTAKELKKYPVAVRVMAESGCSPEVGKKPNR